MSEELNVTVNVEESPFGKLREAIMDYVYAEGTENDLALLHDIEDIISDLESDYKELEEERDRYHKWWHEEYVKVKAYELLNGKK